MHITALPGEGRVSDESAGPGLTNSMRSSSSEAGTHFVSMRQGLAEIMWAGKLESRKGHGVEVFLKSTVSFLLVSKVNHVLVFSPLWK